MFYGQGYAHSGELSVAATSQEANWNVVAPFTDHYLFALAAWTGSKGLQLVYVDTERKQHGWPDKSWNSWTPRKAAENTLVNINAIRLIGSKLN